MPLTLLIFKKKFTNFGLQVYHYVDYVHTKNYQNRKQNGGFPQKKLKNIRHFQTPFRPCGTTLIFDFDIQFERKFYVLQHVFKPALVFFSFI